MKNLKNTCINKHYVYLHFNEENDGPFYCGSGIKERAGKSGDRNKYWHEFALNGWWKKIVAGPISREDARELEEFLTFELDSIGYCQANLKAGNLWMDKEPHPNKGQKRPELSERNKTVKPSLGLKRPDVSERNKIENKKYGRRIKQCLEVEK